MLTYWWCRKCGPVKELTIGCPLHGMRSVILPWKCSPKVKSEIIKKIVSDAELVTGACATQNHSRVKGAGLGLGDSCSACERDKYLAYIAIAGVLRS